MTESDPRDYRSLGDLLRDARAERKLTLEQVNESTRISVRVLRALEQDDLEAASGPIYARGFVRTLAKFYDLDPEWLGAKLDQLAGETSRPVLPVDDEGEIIAGPLADPVVEEQAPPTGPKWEVESTRVRRVGASNTGRGIPRNVVIYGLVIVLVVASALVWWLGRGSSSPEDRGARAPATRDAGLQVATELPESVVTETANDDDAGTSPAFVVEDPSGRPTALGSVLDEPRMKPRPAQTADGSSTASPTPPAEGQPVRTPVKAATGSSDVAAAGEESTPERTDIAKTPTEEQTPPASETSTPDRTATGQPVAEVPSPDPDEDGASGDAAADAADDLVSRRPQREATRDSVAAGDVDPAADSGLLSVVRPAAPSASASMELVVRAAGPVQVTLSADGEAAQTRRLVAGETWALEGSDHFSLAVSDPSRVTLELDGRPRALPSNWAGDEWILYPPRGDGGG